MLRDGFTGKDQVDVVGPFDSTTRAAGLSNEMEPWDATQFFSGFSIEGLAVEDVSGPWTSVLKEDKNLAPLRSTWQWFVGRIRASFRHEGEGTLSSRFYNDSQHHQRKLCYKQLE